MVGMSDEFANLPVRSDLDSSSSLDLRREDDELDEWDDMDSESDP